MILTQLNTRFSTLHLKLNKILNLYLKGPGEDEVVDEDRDREFEERRLKIEREQELIYEQEEQHFREVVNIIILYDKRLNQFLDWHDSSLFHFFKID